MRSGRKIKMKFTRSDNAYKTLANLALYATQQARAGEDARSLNCLTAILAWAFALEGFLNFLGSKLFPCWESAGLERKLAPVGKLKLIAEKLDLSIKMDKRPYKTFTEVFTFRNELVHPKNFEATEEIEVEPEHIQHRKLPAAAWEKSCDLGHVETVMKDARVIVQELWTAAGITGNPYISSSRGQQVD